MSHKQTNGYSDAKFEILSKKTNSELFSYIFKKWSYCTKTVYVNEFFL